MSAVPENNGPFKGIKVVDLTTVVFAPYATKILADLGAEVVKIESKGGDIMRYPGSVKAPAMGPIYLSMNRNKESVELDITKPAPKEAFMKLIAEADLFVTNVRLQALQKLGLSYDDLKAVKPDLVYVHGTGFDTTGPYGGLAAYDDLIQAASGMSSLVCQIDKDNPPRHVPATEADKIGGLHVTYAAMAALFHRERTGEGQHVEVPMMESAASFNLIENMFGNTFVPQDGPVCYTRTVDKNRKPFPTKDGYISIVPYSDRHWIQMLELGNRQDLLNDPRLADFQGRTENIGMLYAAVGEIMATRTTDEWFSLMSEMDIPCMKVNTLENIQDDPHFKATGFFEQREHPVIGPYISTKHPVRFEKSPAATYSDPPTLGQNTEEVLARIGYTQEQITEIMGSASSENKNDDCAIK
jgi:crotonobetainyl-CoA:carnitine CoA-transferase CaiB-like acyl-CoA transferase